MQAAIVELLEGGGIDNVVLAGAVEENDDRVLGELLAEAVTASRVSARESAAREATQAADPDAPEIPMWGASTDVNDRFADSLPDIQKLVGAQAQARMAVRATKCFCFQN